MPFMVPQETGLRLDSRWFALGPEASRAGDGPTLVLWGERPLAFSALPWSAVAVSEATHTHQLRPDGRTHVHLDVVHRGLGSAACGPDTDARFRFGAGTYRWTWHILAVDPGTDPASVIAPAG